MKKITLLSILALLLCVVSCQISNVDGVLTDDGFKVTAVIDNSDATRVTYAVDNETAFTITPTWSVGDKIIGFDDKGTKFTFTVTSLEGEKAILDAGTYDVTGATKLYAIYAPGCTEEHIKDGKLIVSLNPQNGQLNDAAPVLMCATADVVENSATLTFEKQTAVLGLKKFKLPTAEATTITSMSLVGAVTNVTFAVTENVMQIHSNETGVINLKGSWETNAEGICETPVYFSVAPQKAANLTLNASTGAVQYANVTRIAEQDIEAGYYYHMTKIMGEPVVSVGDQLFASLEEAFAYASKLSSATIQMKADYALKAAATLNGMGNYTLDLNGKTVTTTGLKRLDIDGAKLTLVDNSSANVEEQGKLTTVSSNTSSYILVVKGENGKLIMNSGNIVATGYRATNFTEGGCGELTGGKITAPSGQSVTIGATGGTVNISGTFEAYSPKSNVVRYYGGTGTISGGKFSNDTTSSAVIYADGESVVTITGGYYKTPNVNTAGYTGSAKMYVNGGFHSNPVRVNYAIDAQDHVYLNAMNYDNATQNEYPYTIVMEGRYPLTATVTAGSTNTWKFGDIESAGRHTDSYSKATGATTLKIEKDLESRQGFVFAGEHKYEITVDLNGHKLTSSASPALLTESAMKVMDGGGDGEIVTTGDVALSATAGKLTVNGGSFAAAQSAVLVGGTANLVVNNGYFYGNTADIANAGTGTVTISAGRFKSEPDPAWLAEGCASSADAITFHERNYAYKVAASSVVATVNGTGYATLGAAAAAAVSYAGDAETVTLQLQEDIVHNEALSLTHASKPVVLDLNGHVLSTSVENFIYPTAGTLTITDSAETKGKLTTSSYQVLYPGGSANVTISNCVVEGTIENASAWNAQTLIICGGASMECTISNAIINATKHQTAIRINNSSCKVTITDSEVSSGTVGDSGFYAIINNAGNLTINNSSLYTKSSTTDGNAPSALHHSGSNAKTIINSGYFYAAQDRTVSGGYGSITINGGYFDKAPGSSKVTYAEGLALTPLDPKATHVHKTTGATLEYGYQVK